MRGRVAALGLCALGLAACGGDEGILVVVTEDDVAADIERLEFVVGVWEGDSFVATPDPPSPVDVGGRDLVDDPYRVFLHDGERTGEPSMIVVAVIGYSGDQPAAFGAFDSPQMFLAGKVLRRDVVLNDALECAAFSRGDSGCIDYRSERIGTAEDRFCEAAQSSCECREGGPSVLACYDGETGTPGVGVCRAGIRFCNGDASSECIGQVTPGVEVCNGQDDDCDGVDDEELPEVTCGIGACTATAGCNGGDPSRCTPGEPSTEQCNDIDDDCDGAIDEDCPCIKVSPNGDDLDGDGETVPVQTIGRAIELAETLPDLPRVVCVASTDCDTLTEYAEPVAMASGIHVQGGYEEVAFTRCALPATVTAIRPGNGGLTFGAAVQTTTVLDGFKIFREEGVPQTVGIAIDGASGAVVSGIEIPSVSATETAIGVAIKSGASAVIQRSEIRAGAAGTTAFGVLAQGGSSVDIRHSCGFGVSDQPCADDCAAGGNGIYAENPAGGDNAMLGAAIRLESSTATVTRSLICAADYAAARAIDLSGDGANAVIEGNAIEAVGVAAAVAIRAVSCGGASPLIVGNPSISAGSAGDAVGVLASGDCRPVVHTSLVTMRDVIGNNVTGVACQGDDSAGAGCSVIDTDLWIGAPGDDTVIGISCQNDGCRRLSGNDVRIEGGATSVGVNVVDAAPLIDDNRIAGACGAFATGLRAEDASARIENNLIYATTCEAQIPTGLVATGLQVLVGSAGREVDVHSNLIEASAGIEACTATGIELGASGNGLPGGPLGLFRNNIVAASRCGLSTAVAETVPEVDPRKLRNNDLVPTGVLYRDEAADLISEIDDVNSLPGVLDNLSVDPDLIDVVADPHLQDGSMCIDAGTAEGAPEQDFDGEARDDGAPDIGPDEN